MIAQIGLSLALAAGIAAGAAGLYLEGKRAGKSECQAADLREREIGHLAAASAATAAAQAISRLKVTHTIITNEVQREVLKNPIYSSADCMHSPEQLQRLNAALAGERPEPAGGGVLPRADAAAGPQLRGDHAEAGGGGRSAP